MEDEILVCESCGDGEIENCDRCKKKFSKDDPMFCLCSGMFHFCTEDCLHEFIKTKEGFAQIICEIAEETTVIGDD